PDLGRGEADAGSGVAGFDHVREKRGALRGRRVRLGVFRQQPGVSITDDIADHAGPGPKALSRDFARARLSSTASGLSPGWDRAGCGETACEFISPLLRTHSC